MIMKQKSNFFILLLAMAVAISVPSYNQAHAQAQGAQADPYSETYPVNEVRVNGAQRIDTATVLTYVNVAAGTNATNEELNQGLKNLYNTGLFADVDMRYENGIVYVDVEENPIINEIAFEGNGDIENGELLSEISLRPRQAFTRTKVQNDVSRLHEIYRRSGRFAASIDPKIIELDQNRVNLVFEITEGGITQIKGIRFIGNEIFSDAVLQSELSTKEERWYKFLSSNDRYDPDRVEFDKELLRQFYRKEGYVDFQVAAANAELAKDHEDFFLTFNVNEGPRYRVNSVAIDSNLRGFDGSTIRNEVNVLPGAWLSLIHI